MRVALGGEFIRAPNSPCVVPRASGQALRLARGRTDEEQARLDDAANYIATACQQIETTQQVSPATVMFITAEPATISVIASILAASLYLDLARLMGISTTATVNCQ